jgi:hypothetical protein
MIGRLSPNSRHTANPMLARWMYNCSGAKVTEIKAGHLVYISHPSAVARVIETAARDIK